MALVPWRPFEDLSTLRREMDRLFQCFLGEPLGCSGPPACGHHRRT